MKMNKTARKTGQTTTKITRTAKKKDETDQLHSTAEDHATCGGPQTDGERHGTEVMPSEFFVSPLREPLTDDEVRAAWGRAPE